ncbi:MAG: PHP domain-containing protein [Gemmatimonadota bacterium]|nr:PHP domain-containing protein [Gemmatimonadota bacterium]MDH5760266.1 PHP domain-containing protein [Gemmatimonadota bacterium]
MRIDLHIHTDASDGQWSAAEVIHGAARGGLDVIAIADHDTTRSVEEARELGRDLDVQVIPAIEVSSTSESREIHVLGYFVDPDAPSLRDHESRACRLREDRMREMVARLVASGVDVTFEQVLEQAGGASSTVGRPHLARALVDQGYASSIPDAFNAHIGDHRPAFVPTGMMSPEEAVELVLAAGGIPMWAHPPGDLVDQLLPGMIRAGLGGMEVYRPTTRRNDILRLEGICRTSGLLMSGGSDWHTPLSGQALGDFFVTADEVEGLLAAGGL